MTLFCIICEELLRDIDTEMSLEESTLQLKETLVLVAIVLIFLVEIPPKKSERIIRMFSNKTEWNTQTIELQKISHGGKYLTIKYFLDYMGVPCTFFRMNELDYKYTLFFRIICITCNISIMPTYIYYHTLNIKMENVILNSLLFL